MKLYLKEIGSRMIALMLAVAISLIIENSYKVVIKKSVDKTNETEQAKLIDKAIVRNNEKEQIVGVYEGRDIFGEGRLYIFPDETWMLFLNGFVGETLNDKGNWVYNSGKLILISDKSLRYRQSSRNRFYWLINYTSKHFLIDIAYYKSNSESDNPYSNTLIPYYSYEKAKYIDFSSYEEFKRKEIKSYWDFQNFLDSLKTENASNKRCSGLGKSAR